MNQDLSASAFSKDFCFENHNLRLSTLEGNTLMSWVNERKPLQLDKISIKDAVTGEEFNTIHGFPVGTAVINHKLVLFTTDNYKDSKVKDKYDYIYVIDKVDSSAKPQVTGRLLFKGNINLNAAYPLETLASHEAENIQKIYWTDGHNQPRMINIEAKKSIMEVWRQQQSAESLHSSWFDFLPEIGLEYNGNFTIRKEKSGNGKFAPGVIQYCYTYFNKYGQQTNVVDVSPLEYICYNDRGAKPDESIGCSFNIYVDNINYNYEYVRLYSIQRTSINSTPIVKILADLPTSGAEFVYIDNGTTGSSIDPTTLLYIGGRSITALTMEEKSNTLFLGNISLKNSFNLNSSMTDDQRKSLIQDADGQSTFAFRNDKTVTYDRSYGIYANTQLSASHSQPEITTFKGGEWYRFGIQLQSFTGEWSEPIYLTDQQNKKYPMTFQGADNAAAKLVTAGCTLYLDKLGELYDLSKVAQIRPVIVYPTMANRSVVCQGVINPTVFNSEDRMTNSPYAQASWFFRPYTVNDTKENQTIDNKNNIYVWDTVSNYTEKSATATDKEKRFKDQNFIKNTNEDTEFIKCSVLVGSFKNGASMLTVLSSGCIGFDSQLTYDGIIELYNRGAGTRYVFVKIGSIWPFDIVPWSKAWKHYYTDVFSEFEISTGDNWIYKGLKVDSDNYLYYSDNTVKEGDKKNTYEFRFITENDRHLYKVIFKNLGDSEFTKDDILADTRGGTSLPFGHYKPLITQNDVETSIGTDTSKSKYDRLKEVEIQGSQKVYGDPFSTEKAVSSSTVYNNTEFFVDQSIVTLNSPDIEFDKSIRNQDTNGLKLRIVGAIPITSNASAHHIYYKNSMLPLNANVNLSDDKVTSSDSTLKFGQGELPVSITYNANPISTYAGNRLVADWLWNDAGVTINDGKITTSETTYNYMVYPWQRTGSLNGDSRTADKASSYLSMKKESTLLYSMSSVYNGLSLTKYNDNLVTAELSDDFIANFPINKCYDNVGVQMVSTEGSGIMNVRLPKQGADLQDINYYPNIDKVLINGNNYNTVSYNTTDSAVAKSSNISGAVTMKYKSTPHAVIDVHDMPYDATKFNVITYMPIGEYVKSTYNYSPTILNIKEKSKTFWGEELQFATDYIRMRPIMGKNGTFNYLWLGELYRDINQSTLFGGTTESALRENTWNIGGNSCYVAQTISRLSLLKAKMNDPSIDKTSDEYKDYKEQYNKENALSLTWDRGDTYYQRYDCLKTYPFTSDDVNQITEILSFMCETHINLDGRYDRNRGLLDNTNVTPVNFNLMNDVYSQTDNFFSYKSVFDNNMRYPNTIAYTLTKTPGADIDEYTHVTLASVLSIDGNKGSISAIRKLNDALIVFQDTAIAQLLYNENVQISTQAGVPIEIANSGKVQGARYISNTIGCTDKASIAQSPNGLYFIDSYSKALYLFNGQLKNISADSMNSWMHRHISIKDRWRPDDFGESNAILAYDALNHDILLMDKEICLAYSELIGAFTSFYDYGNIPYLVNYEDTGLWIGFNDNSTISRHNAGDYFTDYSTTIVANPEPLLDKIFSNIDLRATVDGEGETVNNKYVPYYPFDTLEAWNEYQDGMAKFSAAAKPSLHGLLNSSLARKYRIWHCDIPRDNANKEQRLIHGLSNEGNKMARIRNPWTYLKMASADTKASHRTEIHDITVTYFS